MPTTDSEPKLYQLLGASPEASPEEIKNAYKKRARELHPDRNQGDGDSEEQFKQLNEAYRVLSDPELRKAYDRLRTAAATAQLDSKQTAKGPLAQLGAFFRNLADAAGPPPEHGPDLSTQLDVQLADLVKGAKIRIQVPTTRVCSVCAGESIDPNWTRQPGERPPACPACSGTGREATQNKLEVKVPPGVEDGSRLRLKAEGEPGLRGGRAGDLYLTLNVKLHPLLSRKADQLSTQVPVPLPVALLGGAIQLPGPQGTLELTIPPGTQSGHVFRLDGQGLPPAGGGKRGDLVATVQVEIPRTLSVVQKRSLAETLASLGEEAFPDASAYLKTLRSDQW